MYRRSDVLALGALLAAGCLPAPRGGAAAAQSGQGSAAVFPAAGEASAVGFDHPASVSSGDAYIRYDPTNRGWTLGNSAFEERLELQPLADEVADQGTPAAGVVANTGYRLVRRSLVSQNHLVQADIAEVPDEQDATQDALGIAVAMQPPRLVPLDQELTAQPDGVLFGSLRFRDPALNAELTAEFRLRPQFPVVEHRCSLRYAGEQQIRLTRLDAADFVIRSGTDARWRAATLDTTGDITFVRLGREGVLEAETPAQSAARAPVIPLLVLHDAARDEGLTFALRWSTNYLITARSLGDRRVGVAAGVRMFAAPELDPAAAVDAAPGFDVHPGQTVSSPWLLLGIFDGAMEDASHALKDYLMADRPREPSWASKVLPITWNSWFAYGTGVDYDTMRAEAEEARKLAIEVFYVDYGWSAAQGDWTPHPQRFPGRTLIQLADQVHKLGMRFGLWVAFGVADRDSTLLRTHPTFLAKQPAPARTGIDGSLPLCLSTAQPWVQGELTRIVRQYKLDWLKFDQPMVAACLDPAHKHDTSVRGSLQANTQAFYDILRTLRDQFPELFIESTFDGAGYLDYGVFARSHSAWLDDAAGDVSEPMTVPQQSFYGATLAFPARFLTLWLARGPVGPGVDGRSMSPDDLRYQGYSTMGGSWGLSLRLPDLEPDQRQAVESLMGEYRTFRDLIPGASVYHLQPPLAVPLGVTQGPTVQDWFALQYVHPDLRRGALLAVRNAGGADQVTLRLRGLEAQTPYQVTWSDGTRVTQDLGQALMQKGVVVALDPFSGGLLWITPTA